MPRITEFFLVDTPAQDTAVISAPIPERDIPEFIGRAFAEIGSTLWQEGSIAADCPFLRIIPAEPGILNVTAGTAVSKPIIGSGDVIPWQIPAGKKLFCYYQGDNALMEPVYGELAAFAKDRGFVMEEGVFEYYLNGPEYGTDKLLTRVMVLLS
ncbi:GyrI-like domain-containing protein [Breznakiella homolactica]|uniref:GyrI-like domain-containing protein n=1 Tax=Breznakiella homolactica TaxID=2798577 RepID=A0A7T8BAC2_9SPIR|nr:GyrI-like domain-containing protein [Breznakiella homolactica]QQO08855.1 GyrI-like domain-containing protein [Breznakiella homolactica]